MAKIEGKLYVGVDWSTGDQVVSLHDERGAAIGTRTVAYDADALAEFCDELTAMVSGEPERVQVAIETPHGAVVDAMLERGFAVFAINPKQLSRFRDRFTAAGAKDDRRDARVLADSLRTDPRAYRRLEPEAEAIVQLREWSRMLERLKQDRVSLGNRMREQLRRYFPQFLELSKELTKNWMLELWDVAPTPARARRVQKATIARILRSNRIRAIDAATVLQRLRQSPLIVASGVTEAATAHIRLIIEQLRVVNSQIKRGEQQLDALFRELVGDDEPDADKRGPHDVEILRSLPGVGRVVLAVLLAEGSRVLRDRDYQQLRRLSGVAPVTVRSGRSWRVSMRRACHHRLREALYHMGRTAIQKDERCRTSYAKLRARGHPHGRALRSVADHLLRVACAMLRDGTLYEASRRSPDSDAATAA